MERNPEYIRKGLVFLACAALLCGIPAARAEAFPAVDGGSTASLTVTGIYSEKPVSGVDYSLYRVADLQQKDDGSVSFPLTASFEAYAESIELELSFESMSSDKWTESAATLAPYLVRDKVQADASAVSGADGSASFGQMPLGLYLMTASYAGTEYQSVSMAPCFLTLPGLSEDQASWIYSVSAAGKLAVTPKTPGGVEGEHREQTVTARKAWSGDSSKTDRADRPASVEVQLLDGSGNIVDTQTLSGDNGWSYEWKDLDPKVSYSVVEKNVPSGYTVTVKSSEPATDSVAFVLTNKKSGVKGENRPKKESQTPATEKKSGVAGEERLPQTGQLWWPVFLMAGAGVILVLFGLVRSHSGRKDLKG